MRWLWPRTRYQRSTTYLLVALLCMATGHFGLAWIVWFAGLMWS